MAVNLNQIRTRIAKLKQMYNRFDGSYYDNKSDDEYKNDYNQMDQEAKSLESTIDQAWELTQRELLKFGNDILKVARSRNTTSRANAAQITKLIDQKKLLERYTDELNDLDYEYHAPSGRRFR